MVGVAAGAALRPEVCEGGRVHEAEAGASTWVGSRRGGGVA